MADLIVNCKAQELIALSIMIIFLPFVKIAEETTEVHVSI